MDPQRTRRSFLFAGLSLAILGVTGRWTMIGAQDSQPARPPKPPPLDLELVRTFVGASHSKPDVVREMYAEHPTLINAAWDWGGGDWETGLGAASHVGNVEIAEFLLERGARADVFSAVMLGRVALFDAYLAVDPAIVHLPGPHGLSLEHHATKGGQDELYERIVALKATTPAPAYLGSTS